MPDQSDVPDDLEREIERLRRELERADRDRIRLERERDRLRRERDRLQRERDRLRRENERLQQALDLARRAAKRPAAPFSKGPPSRHPRRPGRRAGRDDGRHGQRARPAPIDDVIPVGLPAACPHCAGAVEMTRVAAQYQEELPDVRPLVRRFDVAIGRCTACGRRLQGRHPLQTSNALGAAGVQLGPQAVALMVQLNKQLGLSHGKIATLLRDRFGVTVTSSTVTRALHRAARQARPTYVALCETVRGRPVVVPDETSWRVNGHGHWLWAFATPETTVYAIQPGRGFTQAAAILGAEYAGVLVRDGWAPYRQFTAAAHQTCLAHLLRRCRDLRQDHPRAQFARRVQAALQQALRIRDRRDAGTISRHGPTTSSLAQKRHPGNQLHLAGERHGPAGATMRHPDTPDVWISPSTTLLRLDYGSIYAGRKARPNIVLLLSDGFHNQPSSHVPYDPGTVFAEPSSPTTSRKCVTVAPGSRRQLRHRPPRAKSLSTSAAAHRCRPTTTR